MPVETTYTEARANFARYGDRAAADRETVIIKRRGAPDVALIAADRAPRPPRRTLDVAAR